jgi:hypothetical protein
MLRMQTFCLPLNPITVNDHSLNLHTCEQNITKKTEPFARKLASATVRNTEL